jgi:hypothetical protein
MGLAEAVKAAGLGTPYLFAVGTYFLFHWLDRNASLQATRAISAWFKGEPYRRLDVGLAILAAFDRLYGSPLFSIRAFSRSAVLSTMVWIGFALYGARSFHLEASAYLFATAFLIFLGAAIVSDYISLFIVRRCLIFYSGHPFLSLFAAALAGILVIIVTYVIGLELLLFVVAIYQHQTAIFLKAVVPAIFLVGQNPRFDVVMLPALAVHLWLPLTAIAGVGARLLYPMFRAIAWAQWFLKQGNRHPLRAVGMIASVLVFVGAAIGRAFVT